MRLFQDERVQFLVGSGRELGRVLSDEMIKTLPRPLLVIEDADHEQPTTSAVLEFFHPILQAGEYIVVEDALTSAGPRDALAKFFTDHPDQYEVDTNYCDYFGYNTTWCINGFLRKLSNA